MSSKHRSGNTDKENQYRYASQSSRNPNTNAKYDQTKPNSATRVNTRSHAACLSLRLFFPNPLQLHFLALLSPSTRLNVSESGRGLPQLPEDLD